MKQKAFTLVEILVSLAIFTMFITLALSTLFVANSSSKQSTAIKTAIDNVQYSIELFTRTARLGTAYTCFDPSQLQFMIDPTQGFDCVSGQGVAFMLYDPMGTPGQTDIYAYYLDSFRGDGRFRRCVFRDIYSGGSPNTLPVTQIISEDVCTSLTANEVNIENFEISVTGSNPTDSLQPSIRVKDLSGSVKIGNSNTGFAIKTFISQRQYE